MSETELQSEKRAATSRWAARAVGLGLVGSVAIVYSGSLHAPFIFDDIPGVVRNETIRQLWPPWAALHPPVDGSGVSGRPLVNLSLAINYAWGGLGVRGYHLVNVGLHALTALTLWGVLRRSARRYGSVLSTGKISSVVNTASSGPTTNLCPFNGELFAGLTALLWAVHPLLTESVVCVVQRNEGLSSLFYLLTIYCFIRAADTGCERGAASEARRRAFPWLTLSVLSCLAGVASKETVATAPGLIFLYDRAVVAGSFREAWRQRKKYYSALLATWLPLGYLVWHNELRGGTVGFGHAIGSGEYLLTQCRAVILYLKLVVWPAPLVLDYGWPVAKSFAEVWWQAIAMVVLFAIALRLYWKKAATGILSLGFFILLAPSSSVVPLATQTVAEHRMYLPSALGLGLLVSGALTLAGFIGIKGRNLAVAGLLAAAVLLGIATVRRNSDYQTELSIWSDTVAKCPGNPRAQGNLGRVYLSLGRWQEAEAACRKELQIDPTYNGDGRANLGRALTELGRAGEAVVYFQESLRLRPDAFDVHNNYGVALAALGQTTEAAGQYREALRLNPDYAEGHNNLANVLVKLDGRDEAIGHYQSALRLRPDFVDAATNLGRTLMEIGRVDEALPYLKHAVEINPTAPEPYQDLATAFTLAGRLPESALQYESVLRLQPGSFRAHLNLGNVLAAEGKFTEAKGHFETAATLEPNSADAHHNLATVLMKLGRPAEALSHFETTARLLPRSADAQHELSLVLGELQRWTEAARRDEEALRLNPDLAEAKAHLQWLRERN